MFCWSLASLRPTNRRTDGGCVTSRRSAASHGSVRSFGPGARIAWRVETKNKFHFLVVKSEGTIIIHLFLSLNCMSFGVLFDTRLLHESELAQEAVRAIKQEAVPFYLYVVVGMTAAVVVCNVALFFIFSFFSFLFFFFCVFSTFWFLFHRRSFLATLLSCFFFFSVLLFALFYDNIYLPLFAVLKVMVWPIWTLLKTKSRRCSVCPALAFRTNKSCCHALRLLANWPKSRGNNVMCW